jgi:hypothetical protein
MGLLAERELVSLIMPKAKRKWGVAKMCCTICYKLLPDLSMEYHWREKHHGIPYQTVPGALVDPAVTTMRATQARPTKGLPRNAKARNATATNATATNATATNTTATNTTATNTTAMNARMEIDGGGEDFQGQGFGDSGVAERLDDSMRGFIEDGFGETMPMFASESNHEDCRLGSSIRADILIASGCRQETFQNAGSPKSS